MDACSAEHKPNASLQSSEESQVEVEVQWTWEFPRRRGTFFEVPKLRIVVFWIHTGSLHLQNYNLWVKEVRSSEQDGRAARL